MRLSVDKSDPGYHQNATQYEVFVDGELLRNCVTVDTDLELAIVYSRNKAGFLIESNGVVLDKILDLSGKKGEILSK